MKTTKAKYLKGHLILQERDKDILNFIHRFRVVTLSQLHRAFFKDRKKISCFRRVRMLENSKFIKHHSLTYKAQKLYLLTVKGCAAIGVLDQELLKKGESARLYNSQIPHDIALVDVAIALQSLPFKISYLSENDIRSKLQNSFRSYISDAAIVIHEPVKLAIGIEVELSLKSPKKYHEKFRYFAHDEETYSKHLYILDNIELRHYFIKQVKEAERLYRINIAPLLLFVGLPSLIQNPYTCPLFTSDDNSFSFKEFFEALIKQLEGGPLIPHIVGSHIQTADATTS